MYGWTTNPLVEYYVIESMGRHNPSDNASATQYGTVETDGGVYEIWQKVRTNAPSIIGTATFQQYWSVRTKMRCGGTINTGNHFRAWKAAGLALGTCLTPLPPLASSCLPLPSTPTRAVSILCLPPWYRTRQG